MGLSCVQICSKTEKMSSKVIQSTNKLTTLKQRLLKFEHMIFNDDVRFDTFHAGDR